MNKSFVIGGQFLHRNSKYLGLFVVRNDEPGTVKSLADFDLVYAAAGTPRHLFAVDPRFLLQITGAKSAQFCR